MCGGGCLRCCCNIILRWCSPHPDRRCQLEVEWSSWAGSGPPLALPSYSRLRASGRPTPSVVRTEAWRHCGACEASFWMTSGHPQLFPLLSSSGRPQRKVRLISRVGSREKRGLGGVRSIGENVGRQRRHILGNPFVRLAASPGFVPDYIHTCSSSLYSAEVYI